MDLVTTTPSFGSIINSIEDGKPQINRKLEPFHRSVWGDHFLAYSRDQNKLDAWTQRVEELKEEVKRMLSGAKGSQQEIELIDVLQRLGVAYHFEKEIYEALHQIFESHTDAVDDDLFVVALRFRLLRQQGFNVSSDVFYKFHDVEGNFNEALIKDVRGLLSLYEAAHLSTEGEDLLDKALIFTQKHLKSGISNLDSKHATQIEHALEMPLWKSFQRLEHRHYISIYEEEKGRNDVLLEIAKLDFNLLQSLHQRELKDLTRWWKDMDLIGSVPYARDRITELYFFWAIGVHFEPQYSRARIMASKILAIISVIDDIYDVYGEFEELQLFTDALDRWDVESAHQLPKYMKVCYLALLSNVKEIEEELAADGKSYRVPYVIEAVKWLTGAYFTEAVWYNKGYVPLFNEHLTLSLISCGYPSLTILTFVGMGEIATKEAFDWASTRPKIVMDAAIVNRLRDDIVGSKFEQERGHVVSSLECYVKEHGCSKQEACDKLQELIKIAWKGISQACLDPPASLALLMRVVNLARVMEVMYKNDDGYTFAQGKTKERIIALFVEPIAL
ncbi:putative terpene synthase 2 isoform X2 [Tasmannia lanceolata]|uniref:putative terpene synthase 2 isoform X2 n=1 Tax=Tasmannia lanceolata TaxID=3420 RepID=UPI0040646FAC